MMAYNFARHLKPGEAVHLQVIDEAWTQNPGRFTINPHPLTPGPGT
ncbi:hypothetical protein UCMB321_2505 [Pseudomonas batumici]|uniref:Uncharacterized protein n=1 Tax=Pseudomonas batumici TaxID=226910 RepID=A0A0C2EYB2_9PSED|nr:hypothetical protein UCMB321_2505 [Pseudomonas batumici]